MTSKIIDHRNKIWQKYDESVQQQKELSSYSSQFSASNISQNIPPLTGTETPPDELAAAVWQLKQESEKISRSKAKIEQYQSEIAATRNQFFAVVGITILLAVIVLFSLFGK